MDFQKTASDFWKERIFSSYFFYERVFRKFKDLPLTVVPLVFFGYNERTFQKSLFTKEILHCVSFCSPVLDAQGASTEAHVAACGSGEITSAQNSSRAASLLGTLSSSCML